MHFKIDLIFGVVEIETRGRRKVHARDGDRFMNRIGELRVYSQAGRGGKGGSQGPGLRGPGDLYPGSISLSG